MKCKTYLLGLPHFDVFIDHKPLCPILNHYTLDMIDTPRIQRLVEKLCPYSFKAYYKEGKEHKIPDTLSRAPVDMPGPGDTFDDINDVTYTRVLHVRTATTNVDDLTIEDPLLEEVRKASKDDEDICRLIKSIQTDKLDKIAKSTDFHGI